MRRTFWRRAAAAALLAASGLGGPAVAQQPLDVAEVLRHRQVVNPMPGDDFVAFQVAVPRPIDDGPGGSYLHLGVIDQPRTADDQPLPQVRWLVDGRASAPAAALRPGAREVAFLQRGERGMQVAVVPIAGGEAKPFAATPPVAAYRWRPDGKAIAFTSLDEPPAQRAAALQRGIAPVIVDEDWRHLSLWMVEEGGEPRRLTADTTVYDFEWSPDGSVLACACAPRHLVDDSYMFKRLFLVDAATGERRSLADNPGKLGAFAWSPAGDRVAYVSAADRNDPHAGMLYTVSSQHREVASHTPGFTGMVESVVAGGSGFVALEAIGTRTRVRHLGVDGNHEWIFEPKEQRLAIAEAAMRGERLVLAASHAQHPAELFVRVGDRAVRQTDSNPGLAERAFGEQKVVRVRTRDGLMVEGVLILPVGFVEGTRYPFVIVAHGGPESHFADGWLSTYSNWGQLLAARGYVSWYPNYRSSTGYGVAFCKHDHGDPMGKEFEDHLDAIDHFAAQGLIDPQRVGVGGGSYGGYTAAWAATRHSERFAAAVSFVPFVDIRTKWLTTDIPWEFYYVHYQEKWPWQQPGLLADRSPLTWATHCTTPLLVLGGDADPRVHPSQPFMLYRAVKFGTETPVRYVQYPGEGHGNRTNVYRLDYALRTLRWFDHYLKGDGDRRKAALPPMDLDYGNGEK